ncbi:MAG: CTP synthase [Acidobacteria bacterium ADurb.Bin340]|nr:MAG: CTP synthase [Acidobacteria bacterium ADurb.Bin340]
MTKFVFVTGGVLSSVGKGVAAASLGALLEARGLKVTLMKMDPYLNVDPGTMSPFQHGEVFVTNDGAETDLDLGHYERFTSIPTTQNHTITTGRVYNTVIQKERRGDYLGKTVQVIPHITDEIKATIKKVAKDMDVVIVEIGGTVGDIESQPFLEAIRQHKLEAGHGNAINLHVTYVPYIRAAGELKSKPTQHSVKEMRALGLQPDILLCRAEQEIPRSLKDKIALFCSVTPDAVFTCRDARTIYEVPLNLHEEGMDSKAAALLNLPEQTPDLDRWHDLLQRIRNPKGSVRIGVVGKYVEFKESYKSLIEALHHAGYGLEVQVDLKWIEGEDIEATDAATHLSDCQGVLVPGGFGVRGTRGMVEAIRYAREQKVPFFGICLGMQMASVEFARNAAGLEGADSTEFDENPKHRVIFKLRELVDVEELGGTMRLGAYPCVLAEGSNAAKAYGATQISERHRHRYEFNQAEFRAKLEAAGLAFTGLSPDGTFVEIVEVPDHPYYLGCQFHPEFKSKPLAPHPLFTAFVKASAEHRKP